MLYPARQSKPVLGGIGATIWSYILVHRKQVSPRLDRPTITTITFKHNNHNT
ncbi:MAG TPA: hypothetical protein VKM55_30885 [Candidatus Lokiarchaeia archaeon]|nr:hypothetical protein [Candidatus Lokiarchaeia archaeon]